MYTNSRGDEFLSFHRQMQHFNINWGCNFWNTYHWKYDNLHITTVDIKMLGSLTLFIEGSDCLKKKKCSCLTIGVSFYSSFVNLVSKLPKKKLGTKVLYHKKLKGTQVLNIFFSFLFFLFPPLFVGSLSYLVLCYFIASHLCYSAGFPSVSVYKINQSSMAGVWKAPHGFPRLLQSCRLLRCVGLCKEQVSANTIRLVRFLISLSTAHYSLSTTCITVSVCVCVYIYICEYLKSAYLINVKRSLESSYHSCHKRS